MGIGGRGGDYRFRLATNEAARLVFSISLAFVMAVFTISLGVRTQPANAQSANTQAASQSGQALSVDIPVAGKGEFGGIDLGMGIDEFNSLGFNYGDSVDVTLSSGYHVEDIPYYNGYYTSYGEIQICAYPGYACLDFCMNNGGEFWDLSGATSGGIATVVLREAGKYKATQDALNLSYSNVRADFRSDAAFANFRALKGGDLRKGLIYRSASPCNNHYGRASYVDDLMRKNGVNFILDLVDDRDEVEGYIADDNFDSSYFLSLYNADKVDLLNLSADFRDETFQTDLVEGLRQMMANDGPYLMHCTEGKDRTGFVGALLEALAGATYDEIETDYMITYENYYGVTYESDSERYDAIISWRITPMLDYLYGLGSNAGAASGASAASAASTGSATSVGSAAGAVSDVNLEDADFREGARQYLRDGGMTDDEMDKLVSVICE